MRVLMSHDKPDIVQRFKPDSWGQLAVVLLNPRNHSMILQISTTHIWPHYLYGVLVHFWCTNWSMHVLYIRSHIMHLYNFSAVATLE